MPGVGVETDFRKAAFSHCGNVRQIPTSFRPGESQWANFTVPDQREQGREGCNVDMNPAAEQVGSCLIATSVGTNAMSVAVTF